MTEKKIIERAAKVLCEAHNTYRARRLGTGLTFHEEAAALHAACLLRTALDEQAIEAVEAHAIVHPNSAGHTPCGSCTAAGKAVLALKAAQQAAREPRYTAEQDLLTGAWIVEDAEQPKRRSMDERMALIVAAALNADAEGKS